MGLGLGLESGLGLGIVSVLVLGFGFGFGSVHLLVSRTHDCQIAVSMNLPLPDGSRKSVATAGAVPSTMTRAERRCGCWQATPSAAARLSAMAETFAAGATSWNESWLGLGLG